MDNKRVEQPLSLQEALEKAANEVMSCQWDDFEIYNPIQDVIKKAMEEYASQQCASLREENLLKQMSINDQHRSLVAKNEQIEELKKEVERLKADNLNHFKALKEWHEKLQRLQSDNERLREIVNEIFRLPENEEYHERFQLSAKGRDLYKALQSTHNPEQK